jgi:3-hydroxymyristoyl/3-hydroxydecanoyl-(acyl carrier protein) dehydratase
MKFRMVDRILAWQPRRMIRGVKAVSFEEYQLRQRLGDEPCLPESLTMEAMLQLGNWLVMLSTDYEQMGMVVRWEEARFLRRLRLGRRLHMELTVRSWRDEGVVLDGVASDGEKTILEGRGCLAVLVSLAEYFDPADLRVLFSEIYAPEDPEPQEAVGCPA